MIAIIMGRPSAVLPISHQLHAVGFFDHFVPVIEQLRVVGEEVVVAHRILADLRRGNGFLREGRGKSKDQRQRWQFESSRLHGNRHLV